MIQKMISFFLFSLKPLRKRKKKKNYGFAKLITQQNGPIKNVPKRPSQCTAVSVHSLLQYSVLPERIGILVEQLNHRSILGLETPFLSTELEKKGNMSATSTKHRTHHKPNRPKTHIAHTIRPNAVEPHLALGLRPLNPERDINATMQLIHLSTDPGNLLREVDLIT